MNMYSIKPISLLCATVLTLDSCNKTIEEQSMPSDGERRVEVIVGIKTDAPAILTRNVTEAQESQIKNLNLFAYYPETEMTRHLLLPIRRAWKRKNRWSATEHC